MKTDEPEKVGLSTPDLAAEKLAAFEDLFPGVVADGVLDVGRLTELLNIEPSVAPDGRERFGLMWAGKSEAIRSLLTPSHATLVPDLESSVDFDAARNVFIEGDNLEVLKILQKAYNDRVKLIYIDPPYNTGNDFVYEDDFADGLRAYLEFTGQVDEDGQRLAARTETAGRRHSRWLSMIYPRLVLARNLLKHDGIIAVSIDDNEFANLRILMDEVFGTECCLGVLTWRRRQTSDSRNRTRVSTDHEYILVYGRTETAALVGTGIDESKYQNPDNDPRGAWTSENLTGLASAADRPNLHYDIIDPATGFAYAPHPGRGWAKSKANVDALIADGRILFPKKPDGRPREKKFLKDLRSEVTGFSTWLTPELTGFNSQATKQLTELLGGKYFDFPKPVELLRTICLQASTEGEVVLDFFAGSGTTAQAVLELNAEDGGDRRFVLVQLPEPTGKDEYEFVSQITLARIKGVMARVDDKSGLRAFRLATSSFRGIDVRAEGLLEIDLRETTLASDEPYVDDLAAEVLLKEGVALDREWERHAVGDDEMVISDGVAVVTSLDITDEVVADAFGLEPRVVAFLEDGFAGRDAVKANAFTNAKSLGITMKTV